MELGLVFSLWLSLRFISIYFGFWVRFLVGVGVRFRLLFRFDGRFLIRVKVFFVVGLRLGFDCDAG